MKSDIKSWQFCIFYYYKEEWHLDYIFPQITVKCGLCKNVDSTKQNDSNKGNIGCIFSQNNKLYSYHLSPITAKASCFCHKMLHTAD